MLDVHIPAMLQFT